MEKTPSDDILDLNVIPFAVLFLLLTGKHEADIIETPKRKSNASAIDNQRKKVRLQTYVRATTLEEYIEVERTEEDGVKSYKVEARLEPLIVPNSIVEKILANDVSVSVELKNLNVQGVSTFKITGKGSIGTQSATEITFDTPETVKINADYKLNGKVKDKPATGNGNLEISINGLTLFGMIEVEDKGNELTIKSLTLSYNFKDFKVSYTDLKVDNMDSSEVEKYVNQVVQNYLKDNTKTISARLAKDIRGKLNRKLKGVSGVKILAILKTV